MTTCAQADAANYEMRKVGVSNWGPRGTANWIPLVAHWQTALNCDGWGYSGPSDGHWGPSSRAAVQRQMTKHYGYNGPIDGAWGTNTWKAIQRLAAAQGGYMGPIDGQPGTNTWLSLSYIYVPAL